MVHPFDPPAPVTLVTAEIKNTKSRCTSDPYIKLNILTASSAMPHWLQSSLHDRKLYTVCHILLETICDATFPVAAAWPAL